MHVDPDGDPQRFLRWLRDPAASPVDPGGEEAAWAQVVRDAFAFAHARHERSVSDEAGSRLACRAGCDWCCHFPVTTTAPEVRVAWEHARARLSPQALARVRQGAVRAVERGRAAPCPFLLEGRCAVYEARPLACRAWNSTDVAACERAHMQGPHTVTIPVLTASHAVFANAGQALARGIVERGGGEPALLRDLLRTLIAG